jgi:hypothetical protein
MPTPGLYATEIWHPQGGSIRVEVYYNVTTLAIENRGSPGAALLATNSTGRTCPVIVVGPNGPQTINVPDGTTRRTANQLASAGITTRDDLFEMSVALPA